MRGVRNRKRAFTGSTTATMTLTTLKVSAKSTGKTPRFANHRPLEVNLNGTTGNFVAEARLMNVHLSEESRRFIAAQVAAGRYLSEDAVLEDALSRPQQEQPAEAGKSGAEAVTRQPWHRSRSGRSSRRSPAGYPMRNGPDPERRLLPARPLPLRSTEEARPMSDVFADTNYWVALTDPRISGIPGPGRARRSLRGVCHDR